MTIEQTMTGTVSVQRVAAGSKSEQVTVVLVSAERSWLLRRAGGPSFGVDDDLAAMDGRQVTVSGFPGSGVFLATTVRPAG